MFREIHATDEAVDGDADSPTDGAVVACPANAVTKYCKGVTNIMTPTLGGSQNIDVPVDAAVDVPGEDSRRSREEAKSEARENARRILQRGLHFADPYFGR